MHFTPSTNPKHLEAIFKPTLEGLSLKSDEEFVEGLKSLSAEINFDAPDGDFNTVLYLAAANNYVKTVNYLLFERKVNPNVKVSEDLTAAHIAATNGHMGILAQLASCEGIKFTEKDQYGETPLFRAIGNAPFDKLLEVVRVIIKTDKVSISISNEDDTSPIELALLRQNPSVIQLLLENGADVSKRCNTTAASMMMSRSKSSSKFDGAFVFFTDSAENNNLRQCVKLIIEAYNKQHLADDFQEMSTRSCKF